MATTTKAQEMIAWAQTWADFFAPAVADDNAWYTMGGIDGKDAADLGDGLAEVARLLTVAQERIVAQTDAERALAVLDRLWARMPNGELSVDQSRALKDYIAIWEWAEAGEICTAMGDGPTPAAALLALGARLGGQNGPERDERGA